MTEKDDNYPEYLRKMTIRIFRKRIAHEATGLGVFGICPAFVIKAVFIFQSVNGLPSAMARSVVGRAVYNLDMRIAKSSMISSEPPPIADVRTSRYVRSIRSPLPSRSWLFPPKICDASRAQKSNVRVA